MKYKKDQKNKGGSGVDKMDKEFSDSPVDGTILDSTSPHMMASHQEYMTAMPSQQQQHQQQPIVISPDGEQTGINMMTSQPPTMTPMTSPATGQQESPMTPNMQSHSPSHPLPHGGHPGNLHQQGMVSSNGSPLGGTPSPTNMSGYMGMPHSAATPTQPPPSSTVMCSVQDVTAYTQDQYHLNSKLTRL